MRANSQGAEDGVIERDRSSWEGAGTGCRGDLERTVRGLMERQAHRVMGYEAGRELGKARRGAHVQGRINRRDEDHTKWGV